MTRRLGSLQEVQTVLEQTKSIGELVTMVKKYGAPRPVLGEATLSSKLFSAVFERMQTEFFKENPDTESLTCLLDLYRNNGTLPSWGQDEQLLNIYMRFRVLASRANRLFSTKDLVTVYWRLTQSRVGMETVQLRDLESRLTEDIEKPEGKIDSETITRALEIYSILNKMPVNLVVTLLLPAFLRAEKTKKQVIRVLVSMATFAYFKTPFVWRDLIRFLNPPHSYADHQQLRLLHFILTVENPAILSTRISDQETVNSFLTRFPSLPAEPQTLLNHLFLPDPSPLHDEVKYILRTLPTGVGFLENQNIENGFLVDFADEEKKVFIDIDAPAHYFRPGFGGSYFEHGHYLLNGFSMMKYRALGKTKWKGVQVPFYEWNAFYDEREKQLYLSRKLRMLKPIHTSGVLYFT